VLDEIVPENINLFTGNGSAAGFSNMLFTRRRPIVMPGYFYGCIGQMLPAAMGAVVASGNQPAVLVDGDASFMMHLAEFETAVRYGLPLLVVILNNQGLAMEYYHLDAHHMDSELATVGTPDLLFAVLDVYGRLFDRVLYLRGTSREELAERLPHASPA